MLVSEKNVATISVDKAVENAKTTKHATPRGNAFLLAQVELAVTSPFKAAVKE